MHANHAQWQRDVRSKHVYIQLVVRCAAIRYIYCTDKNEAILD